MLPLVICEAMAFQKPVVCSRIDGIPEAVTHEEDGLLVEPEDVEGLAEAIQSLYRAPTLRTRLGKNGRARVLRQFSYPVMSKQYRALMDEVAMGLSGAEAAGTGGGAPVWDSAATGAETEAAASDRSGTGSLPETESKEEITSRGGTPLAAKMPKVASEVSVSSSRAAPLAPSSGAGASTDPAQPPLPVANQPVVLVDMDSTVVDFDGAFLKRWLVAHPGDEQLVRSRKHYELELNFPMDVRPLVTATIAAPGLYASMKAYDGAIDGLQDMLDRGLDVRLVTSPHPSCYAACAAEKFQWVSEHLGDEWCARLMIARDKTHVRGRWLIDDKPRITGSAEPAWEHVHFDQPWNADTKGTKRMMSWADWRRVLKIK